MPPGLPGEWPLPPGRKAPVSRARLRLGGENHGVKKGTFSEAIGMGNLEP